MFRLVSGIEFRMAVQIIQSTNSLRIDCAILKKNTRGVPQTLIRSNYIYRTGFRQSSQNSHGSLYRINSLLNIFHKI